MRTALALLLKFAMTLGAAVIAGFLLGITNWSFFLLVAVVGSVVNYIVGDIGVLPGAGNVIASIGDGFLSAVVAYFLAIRNRIAPNDAMMFAFVFGVIVMVGEYFFHKWLMHDKKISPDP